MGSALMLIGEFSARCQLSAKALRLYDELGLLVPVRVDEASGYRWYAPEQVPRARHVALMRHLGMPLTLIAAALDQGPRAAADAVRAFWAEREHQARTQAATVAYLCALFDEGDETMEPMEPMGDDYPVEIRSVEARTVLSAVRHVHHDEAGAVLGRLLGRMSQAGPGLTGLSGCPYSIYHGAVNQDSDGPVEIVRPMADRSQAEQAAAALGDVQCRTEPAHDEAQVHLTMTQVAWPAQLPARDALEAHLRRIGRSPSGPPRQIMIADWRTAGPDTVGCVLALPLAPAP